jgi:hypothetical protein
MTAPLIPLAIALAQHAPKIIGWLSGSAKAEEAAGQVVAIAEAVTGLQGSQAVDAIAADPSLALQFRQSIMQHEQAMDAMYLATVQDARARDVEVRKTGQYNYRADLMFALAVIVIAWVIYIVWSDPALNEYVKGVFTLILGRFTGYLDMIYQFEYGSTRRGAVKDATISDLAKKGDPHQ